MNKIIQVKVLTEELSEHQQNIWGMKESLRNIERKLKYEEDQKETKLLKLLDLMDEEK